MLKKGNFKQLKKEQKVGFVLLSIFAVLVIVFGFLQIRNNMFAPLSLSSDVPGAIKDQVLTIESLHYRDTDFDGLSDFDELYVYTTSPYLEDSDSDGLSDGVEVSGGTNPLCAEGEDCYEDGSDFYKSTSTLDFTAGGVIADPGAGFIGDDIETYNIEGDQSIGALNLDLESAGINVREELIKVGIESDVLDQFTNEQLEQMFIDSLGISQNITDSNLISEVYE